MSDKKKESIDWVTVREAAEEVGVTTRMIRNWIRQKGIRATGGGPGGGYRVSMSDAIERHKSYRPAANVAPVEIIENEISKDKAKFIRTLSETYSIAYACRSIGIGRTTAQLWRKQDAAFDQEWENALDSAMDRLESSLLERGLEKDTTAAIFLLKGRRPEKYRDHSRVEMTGKDGGAVEIKSDAKKSITGKLASLAERARQDGMDRDFN